MTENEIENNENRQSIFVQFHNTLLPNLMNGEERVNI